MKKFLFACAVLALAPACASSQRLIVRSDPDGAELSIIKRGHVRLRGSVPGVITMGTSTPYEDPPVVIGKAPLTYDVLVVEEQRGFHMPGIVHTDEDKICQQVIVRATSSDGQVAEQIIPVFRGGVADIYLRLAPPPVPMTPPPGQPAPEHGASPVQPQS